jgi:aspartyl-tRNA(Asn)/glutamyl-tRNA(Gln) amidotransferase subunit A
MSELWEMGVVDLLRAYRTGDATPVEATEACLRRIEDVDPTVNAVLATVAESALAAAEVSTLRWRAGTSRPLEGIPYGLKDIIYTEGIPTTGGSSIYGDFTPQHSATLASRLDAAGAVLIAKLHTFEFAFGGEINTHHGHMRNPWDLERTTGGSSSGSGGALAAREMPLVVGTDTGGSIRLPAAYCGITGLKATHGRIPRTGVMGLSWTLDHAGPMARSAADVAAALTVMAGADGIDPLAPAVPVPDVLLPLTRPVAGLRIGVPSTWFSDRLHPDVAAACESALSVFSELGCEVRPVHLPGIELAEIAGWIIMDAECASYHEVTFDRLAEYDERFGDRLVDAQFISAADYLKALRYRSVVQQGMEVAFHSVDALFVPGTPSTAPRFDDMLADLGTEQVPWLSVAARCTFPFNVTGMPALSVPAGLAGDGLPVGFQLAARPFDEVTCLRLAHAFQLATSHHLLAPQAITTG